MSALATSPSTPTDLKASILQGLAKAMSELPACPDGYVRLYRATIHESAARQKKYIEARKQIINGTFVIDTKEKKELANRILANKDKVFGGFYSDSLAASLPYFLRHHEDPDGERILCYIDVPLSQSKKCYFANVSSMMLGAVHQQSIFDTLMEQTSKTIKKYADKFNKPNPDREADLQRFLQNDHYLQYLKTEQRSFPAFLTAYQTCDFKDINDEFFLPTDVIEKGKKEVPFHIPGPDACALTQEQWKEMGATLDSVHIPKLSETRKKLKEFTSRDASQAIFRKEENTILHLI